MRSVASRIVRRNRVKSHRIGGTISAASAGEDPIRPGNALTEREGRASRARPDGSTGRPRTGRSRGSAGPAGSGGAAERRRSGRRRPSAGDRKPEFDTRGEWPWTRCTVAPCSGSFRAPSSRPPAWLWCRAPRRPCFSGQGPSATRTTTPSSRRPRPSSSSLAAAVAGSAGGGGDAASVRGADRVSRERRRPRPVSPGLPALWRAASR